MVHNAPFYLWFPCTGYIFPYAKQPDKFHIFYFHPFIFPICFS